MNELSTCNALECLRGIKLHSERLAAAGDYLDRFERAPRCPPHVGCFYKTFDESIVYIVKSRQPCSCPECASMTPKHEPFLAVVIRGGHGIEGVPGASPGDSVPMDAQGLVLLGTLPVDPQRVLVGLPHLGVAALSLKCPAIPKAEFGDILWE